MPLSSFLKLNCRASCNILFPDESRQYHAPDVAELDSMLFATNVNGKFSNLTTLLVVSFVALNVEESASVYVIVAPPVKLGISGIRSTKISSPRT